MKNSRMANKRSSSKIRLLFFDFGSLKSSEDAISKCHILMPSSGFSVTMDPIMVAASPIVAAIFADVMKVDIFGVTEHVRID